VPPGLRDGTGLLHFAASAADAAAAATVLLVLHLADAATFPDAAGVGLRN
jgi:7-cyano-7-deazaguanine synthase in queuosine biosynthesis